MLHADIKYIISLWFNYVLGWVFLVVVGFEPWTNALTTERVLTPNLNPQTFTQQPGASNDPLDMFLIRKKNYIFFLLLIKFNPRLPQTIFFFFYFLPDCSVTSELLLICLSEGVSVTHRISQQKTWMLIVCADKAGPGEAAVSQRCLCRREREKNCSISYHRFIVRI